MTEKLSCSRCEAIRDVELVIQTEEVTMKGKEVPFQARFYRCPICGEEFETPTQLDANLEAARESCARLLVKASSA